MTTSQEISEFLKSRRDRLTPDDAGFSGIGLGRRRVPGLRREEVALLAGISVEYYIQAERGNLRGVSEDVLEAIARALQLDDLERAHLFDLAHAVKQQPVRSKPPADRIRPPVQHVIDSMTHAAAFIRNRRNDFLAGNRLAYALYSEAFPPSDVPASLPRFVFLDPVARTFYRKWNGIARATVGALRFDAGRDPYDRQLTELIEELSTKSEDFRELWADHQVSQYRTGTQYFRHPIVGNLDLQYESFELTADIGQIMVVYTAEPGSSSEESLRRLARTAMADGADESGNRTP